MGKDDDHWQGWRAAHGEQKNRRKVRYTHTDRWLNKPFPLSRPERGSLVTRKRKPPAPQQPLFGREPQPDLDTLIKQTICHRPDSTAAEIIARLPKGVTASPEYVKRVAREFRHSARVLASFGCLRNPEEWLGTGNDLHELY